MPKDFDKLIDEFIEQLENKQVKNLEEFVKKKKDDGRKDEKNIILKKKAAFDKVEKSHKELSNVKTTKTMLERITEVSKENPV